jgi:hypothetical protein
MLEGVIHLLALVNGVFILTAVCETAVTIQHVKEMREEKWEGKIYISNIRYSEDCTKTKSMAENSG